jgi:hypothetical protein
VGSERCRGWAESWAKRGAKKTASKKIIPAKRFKIPPEKSERSCSTGIAKRKAEEFCWPANHYGHMIPIDWLAQ